VVLVAAALGQVRPRVRLYLKDGTYQVAVGYRVVGDRVQYQSAERDGQSEELPLAMVDLAATERWSREHGGVEKEGPVLSPELAAEEAARHALRPEVAENLKLPAEESVVALDSFQGGPELVPLEQEGSDLNRETAHAVEKLEINPAAAAHGIAELKGASADVQLHVGGPVFYVRVGEDDAAGGGGFVVDTHGAGGRAVPSGGDARSGYVIERLDARRDVRVVNSFRIGWLGTGRGQADVVEVKQETLPGGKWLKLTPVVGLEPGEYALVEVLGERAVNLNVWDFGVHPGAPEGYEVIKPEVRKKVELERRP